MMISSFGELVLVYKNWTYHNIAVNGRRRRHVLVHELVGRGCRVAIELLLGGWAVPFLLTTGDYIVEFLFGG